MTAPNPTRDAADLASITSALTTVEAPCVAAMVAHDRDTCEAIQHRLSELAGFYRDELDGREPHR